MKIKILLPIFLFTFLTGFAQQQTYLLLAYGQKRINLVCGQKIILKKEEIALQPAEALLYRDKVQKDYRYTLGKDHTNIYVEMIPATTAIIFFEFENIYTIKKDGWDCTNTQYGCIKAKDMLATEKAFANYQAQYKNTSFKEVFRWGKSANLTPAAIGENDLNLKWKTLDKKQFLQMTNTRKDIALQVTIAQYKQGTTVTKGNETDLSKMINIGETTITLEPGATANNTFDKASGFEIRIIQKPATKEQKTMTDYAKQIIRNYIKKPDGTIGALVGVGVRG